MRQWNMVGRRGADRTRRSERGAPTLLDEWRQRAGLGDGRVVPSLMETWRYEQTPAYVAARRLTGLKETAGQARR